MTNIYEFKEYSDQSLTQIDQLYFFGSKRGKKGFLIL